MTRFPLLLLGAWASGALTPAAAQITYEPGQSTIFNSSVEVQTSIYNGVVFIQGPLGSSGSYTIPINGSVELQKSVSSAISYGNASAVGQGAFDMSAVLSANSITGNGSITANALLTTGAARLLTDGAADFDIYFTLTRATQVTLDFSASSSTTLTSPNNLAVVFLQSENGFNTVLKAEATGTGSQSDSWSGILPAGLYFLRGRGSYEDLADAETNAGQPTYLNNESFSFEVTAVPEPDTLPLLVLGFAGLGIGLVRASVRPADCFRVVRSAAIRRRY